MSDLVKFPITASFVLERLVPTGGEIAYGFRHGWLQAEEVVALALAKLERGLSMTEIEKQIALLTPENDPWVVRNLVDRLDQSDGVLRDRSSVWLFLALDWLYSQRREFADPLQLIEMLYADFGHPDEIDSLVRFMPAPSGVAIGTNAIEDRWHSYLDKKRTYFRSRTSIGC